MRKKDPNRTYKKHMDLKMDNPYYIPVMNYTPKREIPKDCKHEGETESKNGGYVCLDCFCFLSYAVMKKDNQTGNYFSDIN